MHLRSLARIAAIVLACGLPQTVRAQQPATVTPPASLVAEGIPAIPTSLVEEVRRYTEYRWADLADWHPLRQEMLIVTRFAGVPQIHRVKRAEGARTQLTFFEEPVTYASYEPRTGKYFLFTKDVGGNEFAQVYRYDLATSEILQLTRGERAQNGGIRWSRAGDRIAYGSTRRTGGDRDIWLMDPSDPST